MLKGDNKQTVPRMSNPIMCNNIIDLSTCTVCTIDNEFVVMLNCK